MAGVVVIPLAELVAWGVAGIAAMWMAQNPPKILPREAVVLPPVAASGSLEERVEEVLGEAIADSIAYSEKACKDCPPCVPSVGHVCFFVHMNSVSKIHEPCRDPFGGHIHTHIRRQMPYPECKCVWNDGVTICFGAGEDYMSILNKYAHEGCHEVKNANFF